MSKQKTTLTTVETTDRNWLLVDLENKVVGRSASRIADFLRGKHKPTYTPSVDNGDFVVVLNAAKVKLTGSKMKDKTYYHHTGYAGGIKGITAEKQIEKHPDRVVYDAVWGMLPKNRLSRQLIKKLKIYPGTEHPHEAQNPVATEI